MKIRNKITFIMIPIFLLTILSINITFGIFFENFLLNQEKSQANSVKENIASYIAKKEKGYLSSVNDWGHWDETYRFINSQNPDYVAENLTANTLSNLGINFVIFEKNGAVFDQLFYDIGQDQFLDFPAGFFNDNFVWFSRSDEDAYGILDLGGKFYFIAKTGVTDTAAEKPPVGIMLIGRQIDKEIEDDMEQITGSSAVTVYNLTAGDLQDMGLDTSSEPVLQKTSISAGNDKLLIDLAFLDASDTKALVGVSLALPRTLYQNGMEQIRKFMISNAIAMALVSLLLFLLLGKYLTKPVHKLLEDVKNIDFTGLEFQKLDEGGNGEITFLRKSINNMLRQIEAKQTELKDSQEKLYATLISVGDGVIAVDQNGRIQFMNPVAEKLTGWKQNDAVNEPIETVFSVINKFTRTEMENPVKSVLATEKTVSLDHHTLLLSRDKTERPIENTVAPIKDKYGKVVGCVLVFKDITEKEQRRKHIEFMNYHDHLTVLYNRRFFEEELYRLDVKRNLPLSLIYADINCLKTMNDAFGHQTGDSVIQQVARSLLAVCRGDDIIARTGGDEFIILLPKTDGAAAEKLVGRLKEKIEQEKIMGINVSVSFGWATKTAEGQSTWDILKKAENLMYQKKTDNQPNKKSAVIRSMLQSLRLRSPQENDHSKRVGELCEKIGRVYRLSEEEQLALKEAGELHDIGKIAIDRAILSRDGNLPEEEWIKIRSHPETGYRILCTSTEFYKIAECILAHHERWDGGGYPKGLKGESIPWKARALALADAYDAMTGNRLYRKVLSKEEAVAEIKKNAGIQFDPELAKVFVEKVLLAPW